MSTFYFDGVRMEDLRILEGFSLPVWPNMDLDHLIIPGRSGAYRTHKRKMSRLIEVPVAVKFESQSELEDKLERLARELIKDGGRPLVFEAFPDRQYFAEVDSRALLSGARHLGRLTISFVCHDPFKYAIEPVVTSANSVQNRGSALSHPNFWVQFTASRSEFVITNATTGRTQRIIWNFTAGDVLEIDSSGRRISINGRVQMHAFDFMSQWIELAPGINNLQANHAFMTDFLERWY